MMEEFRKEHVLQKRMVMPPSELKRKRANSKGNTKTKTKKNRASNAIDFHWLRVFTFLFSLEL